MTTDDFKSIRERQGLSQTEMAVKANVSVPTIQALESGQMSRKPHGRIVRSLAEAYGVSAETITGQQPTASTS